MFPEDFVAKQLFAYSTRGDVIFDPFCGRGTTVFESLVNGRRAAGVDTNPVAACVAGAKADAPQLRSVLARLSDLEMAYRKSRALVVVPGGEFFVACFHTTTLQQLLFLRHRIEWRNSRVDRFIAAVVLGCLHGESHKSVNCLSNRMPRTISTKPDYSVRWWRERNLEPPERDVFAIVRRVAAFRLSYEPVQLRGAVRLRDARNAAGGFPNLKEAVKLVVTSPPYLDTTDYQEDQWLRLWFLGGKERPALLSGGDDRHTNIDRYWQFLAEAWAGCAALVREKTTFVVRIGGTRLSKEELMAGLRQSLESGLAGFKVKQHHRGITTEIKNRQTNAFRPGTKSARYEHDFAFELR